MSCPTTLVGRLDRTIEGSHRDHPRLKSVGTPWFDWVNGIAYHVHPGAPPSLIVSTTEEAVEVIQWYRGDSGKDDRIGFGP